MTTRTVRRASEEQSALITALYQQADPARPDATWDALATAATDPALPDTTRPAGQEAGQPA